jgi:hypothetical protein
MRIPSGTTDQYIYFVAVDSTDLKTRETGLTTFTVYRSRNNGTATAMTTPTVAELSAANMAGVYALLADEDMTIAAGNDSEEMAFHITQASMAPVTRVIELYRPKITVGNTLDVTATGAGGIDWGNIENKTTVNDLSNTDINLVDTCTTNADMRGTDNAALATELAKVPKSDGTASWNATALAAIESEANDALVAFFTSAAALVDLFWDELAAGHTVAGSFGKIIKNFTDIVQLDGTVTDAGPLVTDFDTDLTGYGDTYKTSYRIYKRGR